MNIINDQIDFNFSRPLDIQKNLNLKKAESLFENSIALKKKNFLLEKHLSIHSRYTKKVQVDTIKSPMELIKFTHIQIKKFIVFPLNLVVKNQ